MPTLLSVQTRQFGFKQAANFFVRQAVGAEAVYRRGDDRLRAANFFVQPSRWTIT
jgi:hypothetical protein